MDFHLLGPLEVRHEGRPVEVRGAKQRGLLALLLLHANQVVSSDRLVEELWGEESPDAGKAALRVRISQLRKALALPGRESPIVTRSPGYLLQVVPRGVDLDRFEHLVAEADAAEPAVAAEKLRAALGLWRGPALADFVYEPFARAAVGRLEELRIAALEKRIEADLALGRHGALVAELEGLVVEHPLRERFRGQLMVALYRSGRQAEALEVYRAARQELVEALGIEPSPALHELERAILRQDPSLDLGRPPTPQRSILVLPRRGDRLEQLVALAEPLARHPPREAILARIGVEEGLGSAAALVNEARERLLASGVPARSAAFTSTAPGEDAVRLASEQDVDLVLVDGCPEPFDDPELVTLLAAAPCDVAVLVGRERPLVDGPILVPFTGAEHDWAAVELGAWVARSRKVPLRIAGPEEEARDASRLLASVSLAVQRALGVAAEPLLVEPGTQGLVHAANAAALVVVGLSERRGHGGLGSARGAVATLVTPPVVVVQRGLRPGGLAPRESLTRFTWSLGSG